MSTSTPWSSTGSSGRAISTDCSSREPPGVDLLRSLFDLPPRREPAVRIRHSSSRSRNALRAVAPHMLDHTSEGPPRSPLHGGRSARCSCPRREDCQSEGYGSGTADRRARAVLGPPGGALAREGRYASVGMRRCSSVAEQLTCNSRLSHWVTSGSAHASTMGAERPVRSHRSSDGGGCPKGSSPIQRPPSRLGPIRLSPGWPVADRPPEIMG
jgi:hypothetical protein